MILGLFALALAAHRASSISVQAPASLVEAKARYAELAAMGGWTVLPDGPPLEPGTSGDRVGILRRRLAREGYPWKPARVRPSRTTTGWPRRSAVFRSRTGCGRTGWWDQRRGGSSTCPPRRDGPSSGRLPNSSSGVHLHDTPALSVARAMSGDDVYRRDSQAGG